VKIGEDAAFGGHAIEMGRFVGGGAKRPNVGVAKIIAKNDDDVWRLVCGGRRGFLAETSASRRR
jgi:hypothetical protein